MGSIMAFFGKFGSRQVATKLVQNGPMAIARSPLSTASEVTMETKPYKLHRLDSGPHTEVTLSRDDALLLYTRMQLVRRMETSAANLYKDKQVRGFCHLYSGQEAVGIGMHHAMSDEDAIITAYRCHGFTYLMGGTVREVLSELTGRATGNVHGKGGSMHMYGKNYYGGNGIVGAQVPLGAGVAFAYKYRKQKAVCFTLFGDGAANQGQVYEAANMAKLWQLPCIFVIENNGYGMGTAIDRSSASYQYYTRGDYVPGIWVDGMDVLAVREACRFAREFCNGGGGPLFMEMATYRYHGHSMSDPGTSYRTREEIQEVRKSRDPITGFKDRIISANLVTEQELKEIDKSVKKEVDEANQQAVTDPLLPVDAIYCDVYSNTPGFQVRGTTQERIVTPNPQYTSEVVKAMGL